MNAPTTPLPGPQTHPQSDPPGDIHSEPDRQAIADFASSYQATCAPEGIEESAIVLPIDGTPVDSTAPRGTWCLMAGETVVRNVRVATLTAVLPKAGTATGEAVIIAPGGGFMALTFESEGHRVARWFADRGVAAFVLRYRIDPTPDNIDDFGIFLRDRMRRALQGNFEFRPTPGAAADALAAIRAVRARADEFGIRPQRVGLLGFSAGAVATLLAAQTADAATAPAYLGYLYGPMKAVAAPAQRVPLFVALAADDPLYGINDFGLVSAWRQSASPVELHYYADGGHGFGLKPGTSTSVAWIDQFHTWLKQV